MLTPWLALFAGCRAIDQCPAAAFALTTQAANHQRVGGQSRRMIDHPVEFQIVLLHRTGESRADSQVAILVEREPIGLEGDDGQLAFVQRFGRFIWSVNGHGATSLTDARSVCQASHICSPKEYRRSLDNVTRMQPQRPFIIGVAGGTCSGKTTVSERLAELAGDDTLALIKLDSYYVSLTHLPIEERAKFNYDHPDAFDWPLLNEQLDALAKGQPVPVPIYDFTIYDRTDQVRMLPPARIIVVEGILVLWEPTLRERFDLKLYIDTDADLRFIRRLQRDVAERGRTPDSIIAQYLESVRPSHEQFIEPSKRYADVIFPQGGKNAPAIDVLLARVRELAVFE